MNNKKASVVLWISIVAILVLAMIGSYFIFFNMSESRAREIIMSDFLKDSSSVCDRFLVNDENCQSFVSCYSNKAVNTMPKNLMIQFAKDIRAGKSSAIDSYSVINGKNLGEECIKQVLNIPDNVDLDMKMYPEAQDEETQSDFEEFAIQKDIGDYVHSYTNEPIEHDDRIAVLSTYQNIETEEKVFVTVFIMNEESLAQPYLLDIVSNLYDPDTRNYYNLESSTLKGVEVYRSDHTSKWANGRFVISIAGDNHDQVFDAYFAKYS